MPDLSLSFAMTEYDYVMPLITGEVKPDGITLEYQGMPGAVPGVFYDQLKFQRYDVSEMSFSSFWWSGPRAGRTGFCPSSITGSSTTPPSSSAARRAYARTILKTCGASASASA